MLELTTACQALSDATRLRILFLIAAEEKNVTTLCNELGLRQPTVSHHLSILRAMRLVAPRRAGKEVFYGLREEVVTASERKGSSSFEVRTEDGTINVVWRR